MNGETEPVPAPMLRQAVAWHDRLESAPSDETLHNDFAAWVAEDERHARAWALAQKAWRLSGDLPPATAPAWGSPSDAGRPGDRPTGRVVAGPWRGARRRLAVTAAAAVAACLLILASPYDAATWVQADHITATGETRAVSLQDGSTVTLNGDSAIATRFSAGRRRIELLRGEAFFQVTHDIDRPFIVEADDLTVTVTGTAFAVGITGERLLVSVESGSVQVAHRGGASESAPLTRGQRAAIDRHTGMLALDTIGADSVASWRSGRLVVENAALSDVVGALARHHRGAIVIASPSLNEKRVTGVYDLADPARALRALAGPYGGVVREATPYLLTVSEF